MTYRLLQREEWSRLVPLFEEHKAEVPSPDVAVIAVAEVGDEIVAFWVLQLVFHIEPLWIKPESRGRFSFTSLLSQLKHHLPEGTPYYAFSVSEKTEKILKLIEMRQLPWKCWVSESRDETTVAAKGDH